MLDGVLERAQARLIAERMQVVEHDGERLSERADAAHELVDRGFAGTPRVGPSGDGARPESGPDPVDCRRDVGPQANRIVVRRVDGDPGDGCVRMSVPGLREDGLSEARPAHRPE